MITGKKNMSWLEKLAVDEKAIKSPSIFLGLMDCHWGGCADATTFPSCDAKSVNTQKN